MSDNVNNEVNENVENTNVESKTDSQSQGTEMELSNSTDNNVELEVSSDDAVQELEKGMDSMFSDDKDEDNQPEADVRDDEVEDTEDEESEVESDSADEGSSDDSPEGEKGSTEDADDEDYEPIPDDQVRVARELGFTDDEIVKLAEDSPGVLEKLVRISPREDIRQDNLEPNVEPEEKEEVQLLEHVEIPELSDMDPEMAKVVSKMLEAHNSLIDKHNELLKKTGEIDEISQEIKQRDLQEFNRRIDSMFDSLEQHVPEVGNSQALTEDSAALRMELFGVAQAIQRVRGISQADALEEAAYQWKMAQIDLEEIEKKAAAGLKKKLNKQKKRMSPRPGGKKSSKKFSSSKDEAVATLEEGMGKLLES